MGKPVFFIALILGIIFGGKKISKNVRYYMKTDDIKRELDPKFKDRPWELNQNNLNDFVEISYPDEIAKYKSSWKEQCEQKLDYSCRLFSDLIYFSETKNKGLSLALSYCKMNSLQACIAASKMEDFNNSHSEFFSVTNQIISQCEDEMGQKSDADFWACDYYSQK